MTDATFFIQCDCRYSLSGSIFRETWNSLLPVRVLVFRGGLGMLYPGRLLVRIRPGNRVLLLCIIIVFPFFFVGGPGYYESRSFKAVWDLGHILFFTLVSVGLCGVYCNRASPGKPGQIFLRISLIVFIFGLVIEFVQMFLDGRSPNLFDVLRNLLGCLVGFIFFCSVRRELSPVSLRRFQVGTLLLLLSFLWPLTRAVIDERVAAARFPMLSDFETAFEAHRWRNIYQLKRVDGPVRHGNRVLRVQLSTEKYSGVSLFYFPHDWSGYQWLNFSVYNPLEVKLSLHGRIHDRLHGKYGRVFKDRFNRKFTLFPGWNDLQISLDAVRLAPAGRKMDMHEIEGFGIFVVRQVRPLVIYLDNVYLSN